MKKKDGRRGLVEEVASESMEAEVKECKGGGRGKNELIFCYGE